VDFVLAIDFGGTKIAVGAAGPDGELLAAERIETHADRGAKQAVERTLDRARQLMGRVRATTGGDCRAVGAVSPGIVEDDRVLLAPNVPGWDRLRLPGLIGDGLGIDAVAVANDVNAAALAEARWGALAGVDPGLLLSLGTGVKAGIVIGGQVLCGAHGAAGEIGYSLREAADGSSFASGNAPLEEFVGGRALGERAGALLGEQLSGADVFAHEGLPPRFLDEWQAELTMHIANLVIALDPERVAVGGGLMANAELILPALRDRLAGAVPFPPEVVAARFVNDGGLRGAAALALDHLATADLTEVAQ
jgi:glucokinase